MKIAFSILNKRKYTNIDQLLVNRKEIPLDIEEESCDPNQLCVAPKKLNKNQMLLGQ